MSFIDSISKDIMDFEDDRKYDSELLKYQSQIVITKRFNPRPDLEQQRDSVYHSFKLPHLNSSLRQESTMAGWLENAPSMTPMSPDLAPLLFSNKPSNPYFRANTFRTNKRVTDLSMLNIDAYAMTPFKSPMASPTGYRAKLNPFRISSISPTKPSPRAMFESMSTDDIQSKEFSNEEIDKYMLKINEQERQ